MFFLKIEKKDNFGFIFPICKHSKQKAEDSYQSSGLDLYCYVLILNDVHVLDCNFNNTIYLRLFSLIDELLCNTDYIVLIEIK